jgi:hypothetical protein
VEFHSDGSEVEFHSDGSELEFHSDISEFVSLESEFLFGWISIASPGSQGPEGAARAV